MNVKLFRKSLAAFAAAAVAFGGAGIQPLSTLLGTVANAVAYQTNTGGFSYINRRWDDASKQVIREEVKYDGIYTTLSYLNSLGSDHIILYGLPEYKNDGITTNWYVASESLTLSSRMQVTGTVNLVICDGVTLTCNDGILCPSGSALNIYFQSQETGKLIANADTNDCAGIGGNSGEAGGTVNIYGGTVEAKADVDAAGIGGGYKGSGGTVNIYGGTVKATGGSVNNDGGAGIGGGGQGWGGYINIYGGDVTAYSGANAAGIGGGDKGSSGDIVIRGGTIHAYNTNISADGGAGIGCGNNSSVNNIVIYGGDITAEGGCDGAGIGGGDESSGGNITIVGGNVTASSKTDGAGIGGGDGGSGGNITIGGGTVNATGGPYAAGIGGGDVDATGADGGIIKITGGNVTAQGGIYGAGIGGGEAGGGGNITISGGTVNATGGGGGAGIGGGDSGSGGTIEISGGTVIATSGQASGDNDASIGGGAGIGGGKNGSGGTITITGDADVTGTGIKLGAGIGGGGYGGSGGTITISGGKKIEATGGNGGAGIGGGYEGASGKITISGGNIEANGKSGGAGIGSGACCGKNGTTVDITINGGTINAKGGAGRLQVYLAYHSSQYPGAAIGAGGYTYYNDAHANEYSYFSGSIYLNGGNVTAAGNSPIAANYQADGDYQEFAKEDYSNAIGATHSSALDGVTGNVYFNGATVTIVSKINEANMYSSAVRASNIFIKEDNDTHQCVEYRESGSIIPAQRDDRVDALKRTGYDRIFVKPCTHEDREYTSSGTTHSWTCRSCTATATNEAHTYGEPIWTWSEDHKTASVAMRCECGYEVSATATVTKEYTDGKITYTATSVIDDKTYTDTKEIETGIVSAGSLDKVRTFSSNTGSDPVTAAVLTVNIENVLTKIAVTYGGKTRNTVTSIMGDVAIGVIVPANDDLKLSDFKVEACD